jgi:transcriptional regulator with XRE-family HTH domain
LTSLPKRLRAARARSSLTLVALSERTGVHSRVISFYESGEREPRAAALTAIATHLGCSVDWLLGLVDEPVDRHAADRLVPGVEDLDAVDLGLVRDLIATMRSRSSR